MNRFNLSEWADGTMKEGGGSVSCVNHAMILFSFSIRLCMLSFSRPRTLASVIVNIYDRGVN